MFVDENGKVLDREKAAAKYDQMQGNPPGTTKELHSEDLMAAKQEMVGMGGAAAGEVGSPTGQDIYGIAQRVREERAAAGQVEPVSPGVGISSEAAVARGRELLAGGFDVEKSVSDFEKTQAVSLDAVAAARAKGEQLAERARRIEEKSGTDSDEYRAAKKALSDWDKRIKPMSTEAHKVFMAHQGETDIDTGTFTGLSRAYESDSGKSFTPEQEAVAKKTAEKVSAARLEKESAQKELFTQLKEDARSPDKSDDGESSKRVWERASQYIDEGVGTFDEIRHKIATDLGLPVKEVTRLLAYSEKVKRLSDEAWRKQLEYRRLDTQAKRWLRLTQIPGYKRAIANVPRILFGIRVGFHGTVALGTHAPMVAFQPRFWADYVINFGKMYKMVGSPAYYEMQVQDLLRRPNFIKAERAGLQNDPFKYEDYTSPNVAKYFGRLSGMGDRGYFVLKILRQDMFDNFWNELPKTAQIPEVAEAISDAVNHATGVTKRGSPRGAATLLFAPRLLASRGAWLVVDPLRAADTFARWNKASVAEKTFAIHQAKEKAWVAGTMFSLLALNQGFLSATGSDQKINFTDPMRSDFLKFKVGGFTVSYGNAMMSMVRLPIRMYAIREGSGGKLRNIIYPDESSYGVLGQYLRSQASPFASLLAALWFKADFQNRPLPSSNRLMPKRLAAQGLEPYTWSEFWAEEALPIPFQEAVREVWKKGFGMSDEQISDMFKAMAIISFMGGTGGRIAEDPDVAAP